MVTVAGRVTHVPPPLPAMQYVNVSVPVKPASGM